MIETLVAGFRGYLNVGKEVTLVVRFKLHDAAWEKADSMVE